jgi:uncharacterized protein with GYD domain
MEVTQPGVSIMATYIALLNWTEQGVKTYGNTIDRAEAAGELATKLGANLKEIYWTLGMYDVACILEAPNDETVTAFELALSSQGNVRTTTMRAFGADEMREILKKAAR